MPRTLINLDPDDKNWLDGEAKARNVSMTELVRQAVRAFRVREESLSHPTMHTALEQTAGIWRRGDGLAYQQHVRDEWDRRG
jgi:hypothetical protein